MVVKLGINEWPVPGRVVRKATYIKEYHELTKKDGIPFVPAAVWKDLFFGGFILLSIALCAAYFGPFGPVGPAGPHDHSDRAAARISSSSGFMRCSRSCRPRWKRPLCSLGRWSSILALLLLPFRFWRRREELAAQTRRCAHHSAGGGCHGNVYAPRREYAVESRHGRVEPHSRSARVPLHKRSALERQGALVFQVKQCHNCHSLDDQGGKRGPALDSVAVRLTQDQLIRQVIQGGGNMPAYGKNLSPAETTALVAFLETLHPEGQSPARDASRAIRAGSCAGNGPPGAER